MSDTRFFLVWMALAMPGIVAILLVGLLHLPASPPPILFPDASGPVFVDGPSSVSRPSTWLEWVPLLAMVANMSGAFGLAYWLKRRLSPAPVSDAKGRAHG